MANRSLRWTYLFSMPYRFRHLPDHHRDPFDRLLVVQAQVEGLTLVAADKRMTPYDIPMLAASANV